MEAGQPEVKSNERLRRQLGSGGVIEVAPGKWRVDLEVEADPITKRRRRISKAVVGTRENAEMILSRLRIADHENLIPSGQSGTLSLEGLLLVGIATGAF